MLMPSACAMAGLASCTASPFQRTVPASGRTAPWMIFISVLLPAPFSPSTAWISPAATARSMPSFAFTPG